MGKMSVDNEKLGDFTWAIPPMPRNAENIDVTFEISQDGILKVTAAETSTGNSKQLEIKTDGLMDPEQKSEMTKRAAQMRTQMVEKENTLQAKNNLENLVFAINGAKNNGTLSQSERNSLSTIADDGNAWLEANPNATYDEYEQKND